MKKKKLLTGSRRSKDLYKPTDGANHSIACEQLKENHVYRFHHPQHPFHFPIIRQPHYTNKSTLCHKSPTLFLSLSLNCGIILLQNTLGRFLVIAHLGNPNRATCGSSTTSLKPA